MYINYFPSEHNDLKYRLNTVLVVLGILLTVLIIRLSYLQLIKGNSFYRMAEENRIRIFYEHAPRGIIFDRNNEVLVDNVPSYVLYFTPTGLNEQQIDDVLSRLSKLLNIDTLILKQRIPQKEQQIIIRLVDDLSRRDMLRLEENRYFLPGTNIQYEFRRRYRYGNLAGHVLGYLSEISKEEIDRLNVEGYKRGDWLGKSGVEQTYDRFLRGEDGGLEIEVDVRGNQRKLIQRIPSTRGRNVYLTVNQQVQQIINDEFEGRSGAAVVLNPQTGEVIALSSFPEYDPNLFVTRTSTQSLVSIAYFNRALQVREPPGSVYKIVTAITALEENRVNPQEEVTCTGSFVIGREGRSFGCWKKEGHGGGISFIPGITNSCDVYFYQLGLKCGVDLLEKYGRKLGLDKISKIDLPGETIGLIPSRTWKMERYKDYWWDGDTVNIAIGQGYVRTTPLQMVNLVCLVANRGKLYQPNCVSRVVDDNNHEIWRSQTREIYHVELQPSTWELLISGMERVVQYGTGAAAAIPGVRVAGKTGTAQNPHGNDHAWFVAFAPVDNPTVAICIFVEGGGRGGAVAAPIARKILSAIFHPTPKI